MISFNSLQEGKDYLLNHENKGTVYQSLIEDIQDALIFGEKKITLYYYMKENIHHYLSEEGWHETLLNAIPYYEGIEDYEMCSIIMDLAEVVRFD